MLTKDELRFIANECERVVAEVTASVPCSESDLRRRIYAADVLGKVGPVLESFR